jgi:hypothetical protein
VVAALEALGAPPLPVPAAAVEEGQTAAGATAPQAALELPAEADPSGGDVRWSWMKTRYLSHRCAVAIS